MENTLTKKLTKQIKESKIIFLQFLTLCLRLFQLNLSYLHYKLFYIKVIHINENTVLYSVFTELFATANGQGVRRLNKVFYKINIFIFYEIFLLWVPIGVPILNYIIFL